MMPNQSTWTRGTRRGVPVAMPAPFAGGCVAPASGPMPPVRRVDIVVPSERAVALQQRAPLREALVAVFHQCQPHTVKQPGLQCP